MDLTKRLTQYQHKHPQRTLDGVYAFTGFDYQLRVYLADFVQALVMESTAEADAGTSHTLESFPDRLQETCPQTDSSPDTIGQAAHGNTVVLPIKRTLTRGLIADVALAFAAIEHFLRFEDPPPPDPLPRYQLITPHTDLPDDPSWEAVRLPVERWQNQSKHTPRLAECWDDILRDRRSDPIRREPDPWWRIIVAVFPHLDNPFAFAQAALDTALRRGELPGSLVRDQITELFTRHRRPAQTTLPIPGRALTDHDFQLLPEDNPGPLQVGQRPTLSRFRERQFMPRPHKVEKARAVLEGLLETRARADRHDQLTLFRITGRSGVGKSALLLQLMADVVAHGLRVIWFEDEVAGLPPLFSALHPDAGIPDHALPDLVFVDDLRVPRSRQRLDLARLQRILESDPQRSWPIIVTCGPPEFGKHLKADAASPLRITDWALAPVEETEAEQLRNWFLRRADQPADVDTAFPRTRAASPFGDGLMLFLALELQHGEPGLFVERLTERLRATAGLDQRLRLPLALNRFDILAPANWLTEADREHLAQLNRHDGFVLDADPHGRTGLRLTHPYLADILYQATRDSGNPRVMANDLAEAIRHARETDLPTLTLLLRILAQGHERLGDVDQGHLANRIASAWSQQPLTEIADPIALADIRVSLACWQARALDIELERRLQCSLLAEARQSLRRADSAWSNLWQRLFRSWPGNADLLADARTWVQRPESIREPAWIIIWEQLWQQPSLSKANMAPLVRLAMDWLQANGDRRDWRYTWRLLAEAPQRLAANLPRETLFQYGWQWLTKPAHGKSGIRFRHENHPAWTFVWQDLLVDPRPSAGFQRRECLQLGADWLPGREKRSEWSHVWQTLIGQRPDALPATLNRAQLVKIGYHWIREDERKNQSEWAHIWQALLSVNPATLAEAGIKRAQLLESGHHWLMEKGRQDRSEWAHIWQTLLSIDPSALAETDIQRARLLESGYHWLMEKGREEQPEWTHVWEKFLAQKASALTEAGIGRPRLLESGYHWLMGEGRADQSKWNYVWRTLLSVDQATLTEAGIRRARLLERGYLWLMEDGRAGQPEWAHVWRALFSEEPSTLAEADITRASVLESGYHWLLGDGREDQPEWAHIWRALLSEEPSALAKAGIERTRLLEIGYHWLLGEGRENQQNWAHIWRVLLAEEPSALAEIGIRRAPVLASGYHWLMEEGRENQQNWAHVWRALLSEEPSALAEVGIGRAPVLASGYHWLMGKGRENQPEWTHVWEKFLTEPSLALTQAGIRRARLLEIGHRWLMEDGRKNQPEWTYVWQRLIAEKPSALARAGIQRARLLEIGHQWITGEGREEQAEWVHVWRALLSLDQAALAEADIERARLLDIGYQWFMAPGRAARNNWTFIWERLFAARDELPESQQDTIISIIMDWLQKKVNRGRDEWDKFFEKLLDAGLAGEELLTMGAQWARENTNAPQMPSLLAKILRASPTPSMVDDLAAWLEGWVREHPGDRRTGFVGGYLSEELGPEPDALDVMPGWSKLLAWLWPEDMAMADITREALGRAQDVTFFIRRDALPHDMAEWTEEFTLGEQWTLRVLDVDSKTRRIGLSIRRGSASKT
uniref:Uncharacterized protein n=1 Tax=Candidatus Kentrum sp. MB TaxID=2138164 RepID=A0A450XHH1_9GAMM|nr:MAG: hypothetical protein BECKMB1821I_GA0114274_100718 [Candidatus Kentron sp. MB]VFK74087.1 MAG: hypothetical protein BECKMB1821H_GA0114242_100117 [Candidatus Kentron sp. MB]